MWFTGVLKLRGDLSRVFQRRWFCRGKNNVFTLRYHKEQLIIETRNELTRLKDKHENILREREQMCQMFKREGDKIGREELKMTLYILRRLALQILKNI